MEKILEGRYPSTIVRVIQQARSLRGALRAGTAAEGLLAGGVAFSQGPGGAAGPVGLLAGWQARCSSGWKGADGRVGGGWGN